MTLLPILLILEKSIVYLLPSTWAGQSQSLTEDRPLCWYGCSTLFSATILFWQSWFWSLYSWFKFGIARSYIHSRHQIEHYRFWLLEDAYQHSRTRGFNATLVSAPTIQGIPSHTLTHILKDLDYIIVMGREMMKMLHGYNNLIREASSYMYVLKTSPTNYSAAYSKIYHTLSIEWLQKYISQLTKVEELKFNRTINWTITINYAQFLCSYINGEVISSSSTHGRTGLL